MFPSIIDIEMAIDRYFAIRYIKENTSILIKHPISYKNAVIPSLHTPEYIIGIYFGILDYSQINYG